MNLVNWTPAISVGIDSIDGQHKKLIEHINVFYDNLNKKYNKENLVELFKALRNYTVYHFSVEEKLMQQNEFPGFSAHKAEHAKFIQTITSYYERLNAGKLTVSVEATDYLINWIIEHISVFDKNYSKYLIEKGVYQFSLDI